MVFVRAEEGPPNFGPEEPYTVQYFDEKGNMMIRSGGTKAWRNSNPGNMVYNKSGFAVRHGAIGKAKGMAVFPDESTGRKALIDLLKSGNYCNLKIKDLSEKYDKDNAKSYREMILSISKLDPNKKIKDLTLIEFNRLREAIERIEGWIVGKEDFIEKWYISGTHKKRGVIQEYLIQKEEGETWVAKEEAISLAGQGRLHAVIVHRKNGTNFLRPEYGSKPFLLVES